MSKWSCSNQYLKGKNRLRLVFDCLIKGGIIFCVTAVVLGVSKGLWSNQLFVSNQLLTEKAYVDVAIDENVTLVFYENGCPYCEAAEQSISQASKKSPYATFFVNVDSQSGQRLKRKYNVKYSATLVAIRKGKIQSNVYAKKKNGKIFPKQSVIRAVFEEK